MHAPHPKQYSLLTHWDLILAKLSLQQRIWGSDGTCEILPVCFIMGTWLGGSPIISRTPHVSLTSWKSLMGLGGLNGAKGGIATPQWCVTETCAAVNTSTRLQSINSFTADLTWGPFYVRAVLWLVVFPDMQAWCWLVDILVTGHYRPDGSRATTKRRAQ